MALQLTAGMRFAIAYPNPYGLRIPAKRYLKLRSKNNGDNQD